MFQSKYIKRLNEFKKTRLIYMVPTRDSCQVERHTQTDSEGMEKTFQIQMKMKRK